MNDCFECGDFFFFEKWRSGKENWSKNLNLSICELKKKNPSIFLHLPWLSTLFKFPEIDIWTCLVNFRFGFSAFQLSGCFLHSIGSSWSEVLFNLHRFLDFRSLGWWNTHDTYLNMALVGPVLTHTNILFILLTTFWPRK